MFSGEAERNGTHAAGRGRAVFLFPIHLESDEKSSQRRVLPCFFCGQLLLSIRPSLLSFLNLINNMAKHMHLWFRFPRFPGSIRSVIVFMFLWLILGNPIGSLAASPREYDRAKDDLAALQNDPRRSKWREPWETLADRFMSVYEKEKKWVNRPAALYRSALALDELARRSGRRSDCNEAEARYRRLWEGHASSVLADDALYRAARLRAERLTDRPGALKLLDKLLSEYPRGDMADDAAAYARRLAPERQAPRAVAEGKAQARKKGPANREGKFRLHVRRVLLDAGHGGRDPGTHHNGILERTVTLDLAKRVGAILAAHDIDVKYTRFSNRWVSLDARADKVRTTRADLFISIHVNANPSSSVQGFETYYLDFARTSAASRLAAVENAIKGRSAASREKLPASKLFRVQQQESSRLARNIQNTTLGYLRGKKYATVDGGIKTAPFHVLRKSGVPGVLVEVGYCTNRQEAAWLAQPVYRALLARGIAYGILAYAGRE